MRFRLICGRVVDVPEDLEYLAVNGLLPFDGCHDLCPCGHEDLYSCDVAVNRFGSSKKE